METSVVAGIVGMAVVAGIAGRKAADTRAAMAVGPVAGSQAAWGVEQVDRAADRRGESAIAEAETAVARVDWRMVAGSRGESAIATAGLATDPQ
jgi:hypothetical protein